MRGPLLVRGPPALARNLPLLLRGHRCEPAALFPFSGFSTLYSFIHGQLSLCWPPVLSPRMETCSAPPAGPGRARVGVRSEGLPEFPPVPRVAVGPAVRALVPFASFSARSPSERVLPPGFHPNAVPWPGCPNTAELVRKSLIIRWIARRTSIESCHLEEIATPGMPHLLVNCTS